MSSSVVDQAFTRSPLTFEASTRRIPESLVPCGAATKLLTKKDWQNGNLQSVLLKLWNSTIETSPSRATWEWQTCNRRINIQTRWWIMREFYVSLFIEEDTNQQKGFLSKQLITELWGSIKWLININKAVVTTYEPRFWCFCAVVSVCSAMLICVQVSVIDDGLLKFSNLEELVLSFNNISEIPAENLPCTLRVSHSPAQLDLEMKLSHNLPSSKTSSQLSDHTL